VSFLDNTYDNKDQPLAHSFLFQAVTFSSVRRYRNLSRVDPATISTGIGSQTHFHAIGGGGPLVFVSTVSVAACHLIEPMTQPNGRDQKWIEGALVEGEWERLVGCIGQIINQDEYKGPVAAGYISFATALASANSSE
jgi:hypothetical protein